MLLGKFDGVHVLIFDLDGTLIDSKLDLALAVNAMLTLSGRPASTHEEIYSLVGNGAPTLVRRALGEGPRTLKWRLGWLISLATTANICWITRCFILE